ncbi:MAG: sulfite exporter TauE/SafE family protein [Acidimicrobiales bacterium]
MFVAAVPFLWRQLIYLLSGIGAGIANGVAGGGTFVTFPTLLALGVPALQANVSTSVGVLPSYLGGIRGFRHQLHQHRDIVRALIPSCLLGATLGSVLLLTGSPNAFSHVIPWLVGAGTLLFALAPRITRRLSHIDHTRAGRRWSLHAGIFVVSVYGGYFGAGLGILLLAVMAIGLPFELDDLQGLRNVLSLIINACAAAIFIVRGDLALDAVYMLLVGTLIGGVLGTLLITRIPPKAVRWLVIGTGVVTTVRLFWK